jgi:hypothetical protein
MSSTSVSMPFARSKSRSNVLACCWFGQSWKTRDNVSNDYNVNRVAQKNFTYTGIKTFPLQDIAMIENKWGPLANRTLEHLASSDFQIIYRRRRLLKAAKALAAGIEPSEPLHPEAYAYHLANVVLAGATREEAVARAKADATSSRVRQPANAMQIRA